MKGAEEFGKKKERKVRISREKILWLAITIFFIFVGFYYTESFRVKDKNVYNPDPRQIGALFVGLRCESDNTVFKTEDSEFKCNVSVVSRSFEFKDVEVIVQILKNDGNLNSGEEIASAIKFGCSARFFNVTNNTWSESILCERPFDNTFRPETSGTFSVRFKATAMPNDKSFEEPIPYDWVYFGKEMKILTSDEENSFLISNQSLLVAFVAIILSLPIFFFELRKFLYEKIN